MIRGQSYVGGVSEANRALAAVVTDSTGPSTPEVHSRLRDNAHASVLASLDESDEEIEYDDYEPQLEDSREVSAVISVQKTFRGFVVRKNLRLEAEAKQQAANEKFLSFHPFQMYDQFDVEASRIPIVSVAVLEYSGDQVGGRFNGKGKATLRGGHSYEGQWKDGVMDGEGTYRWADGLSYDGTFVNGEIAGNGKFTWPDKTFYSGDVSRGLRHGVGILQHGTLWARYEGEWQNGKRNGHGMLRYDQKGRVWYDGEWKDGVRTGQGTMQYASGNTYEGDWLNDKRHGHGAMWWSNGDIYIGEWENGQPCGKGELIYGSSVPGSQSPVGRPNSARSIGSMTFNPAPLTPNSARTRSEMSPTTFGSQYIQERERERDSDSRNTPSDPYDVSDKVSRYAVVNRYSGEWLDGKRHGEGTFLYANGCKYVGDWSENLKHGDGVFIDEDGAVVQVRFDKDILVSRGGKKVKKEKVGFSAIFGGNDDSLSISGLLDGLLKGLDGATAAVEAEAVQRVVSRYVTDIRKLYQRYASLNPESVGMGMGMGDIQGDEEAGTLSQANPVSASASVSRMPPAPSGLLRRQQLWHMLEVSGVVSNHGYIDGEAEAEGDTQRKTFTLAQADRAVSIECNIGLLDNELGEDIWSDVHHPSKVFLPREFAAALVRIGYAKYGAQRIAEAKSGESPKRRLPGGGILSDCLIKLLTDHLIPWANGPEAAEKNSNYLAIHSTVLPYLFELWDIFNSRADIEGFLDDVVVNDDDDEGDEDEVDSKPKIKFRDRVMNIRSFLIALNDFGLLDDEKLNITRILGALGVVSEADEPKRLDLIAKLQEEAEKEYQQKLAALRAADVSEAYGAGLQMSGGVSGIDEKDERERDREKDREREKRRRERKRERKREGRLGKSGAGGEDGDPLLTGGRDKEPLESTTEHSKSKLKKAAKNSENEVRMRPVGHFAEREMAGLSKKVEKEMVFSEFIDALVACSACLFVNPPPPIQVSEKEKEREGGRGRGRGLQNKTMPKPKRTQVIVGSIDSATTQQSVPVPIAGVVYMNIGEDTEAQAQDGAVTTSVTSVNIGGATSRSEAAPTVGNADGVGVQSEFLGGGERGGESESEGVRPISAPQSRTENTYTSQSQTGGEMEGDGDGEGNGEGDGDGMTSTSPLPNTIDEGEGGEVDEIDGQADLITGDLNLQVPATVIPMKDISIIDLANSLRDFVEFGVLPASLQYESLNMLAHEQ